CLGACLLPEISEPPRRLPDCLVERRQLARRRRAIRRRQEMNHMTSDVQRSAMAILAEAWALSPDVRLGQVMAHLGFLGETYTGRGLGDIDDDELMAVMQRHREEL